MVLKAERLHCVKGRWREVLWNLVKRQRKDPKSEDARGVERGS